jgi:hypothetical protein
MSVPQAGWLAVCLLGLAVGGTAAAATHRAAIDPVKRDKVTPNVTGRASVRATRRRGNRCALP